MFDPSSRLYVRFRGKMTGPFSLAQLEQMRQLGRLTPFHEVSADGSTWHLAVNAGLIASTSMPTPPASAAPSPGSAQPAATAPPAELPWYYLDGSGNRHGPLHREDMAAKAAAGQLRGNSEVWCEGFPDWVALSQTELAAHLSAQPAVGQGGQQAAGAQGATVGGPAPTGKAVIVIGYICCFATLFGVCPPFGVVALVCAILNLSRGHLSHGLVQLFLSIVLTAVSSFFAVLIFQELGRS